LPEQTISHDLVDVIVRGEGELPIKNLANALLQKKSLDEVFGITYKIDGIVKQNPEAKVIDLDEIPIALPYELLQMEKYPSFVAGRFHIQTSRGCPHRCGFCYNSMFNKNRWRGKSAKRVLDEISYIKGRYPHITMFDPIDDNVFVDEYRMEQVCKGLIERKLGVQWRANCRFDYVAAYDKEFLTLLEKAGCVELCFGGESGSERLQQLICKDVTADEMIHSVSKLHDWAPSIEPYVSWMSGLPDETDEDLKKTFDLMDRMSEVNPKTQHYNVFVYTPFPSPVTEYLEPKFPLPQSLEEWGNIDVFHFNPPWHSKAHVNKLHAISAVTHYAFYPQTRIREHSFVYKLAYSFLNRIAKYRWKHRAFSLPIELTVANYFSRRFKGYL
jgi:anaerobic magnesium-protoporphyrin IX monomethyl ester cyclase